MKLLKDIVTDQNDDTDAVSVLAVLIVAGFLMFTGYTVYKKEAFDSLTYATGAAVLIAGIGGGYRLKSGQTAAKDD